MFLWLVRNVLVCLWNDVYHNKPVQTNTHLIFQDAVLELTAKDLILLMVNDTTTTVEFPMSWEFKSMTDLTTFEE
jgi:hypothetical protein